MNGFILTWGILLLIITVALVRSRIRYGRIRDYRDLIERQRNDIMRHATPAPRCPHTRTESVIPYSETEPVARLCVDCLAQLPVEPAKITFAPCPDDTWIRENTWVEDRRACTTGTYMIHAGDIAYPDPGNHRN